MLQELCETLQDFAQGDEDRRLQAVQAARLLLGRQHADKVRRAARVLIALRPTRPIL